MKYHNIHEHWRLSLPASFLRSLDESAKVMQFFWEGTFDFEEKLVFSIADEHAELERFVQSTHPYPAWKLALSARARRVESLAHRVVNKVRRTIAAI